MPALRMMMLCVALLGAGCRSQEMGDTCAHSDECAGDGVCLKGVCGGYGCLTDEHCVEGMVCDEVAEVDVCVTPCAEDGDCLGEQTCDAEAGYCL